MYKGNLHLYIYSVFFTNNIRILPDNQKFLKEDILKHLLSKQNEHLLSIKRFILRLNLFLHEQYKA